jgi:FdhD protein
VLIDDPSDRQTPIAVVRRTEWTETQPTDAEDRVVREEPLEIRIGGVPVAVVMRTPGHDDELVRGFLTTERVVDDPAWVASVRHCTTVETPEAENNVVQVVLREGIAVDLARLRRNLYASSSCGLCGKASIEHVMATAPPLEDDSQIRVDTLYAIPEQVREHQTVFSQTGGLHAAGLFHQGGEALVVREDVGRHNAVDKVIGWAIAHHTAATRPRLASILAVSGRVSFEIVQKALAARIPVVVAVSAPSSLAIELARRADVTLGAFARGRRLCVYAGERRIVA